MATSYDMYLGSGGIWTPVSLGGGGTPAPAPNPDSNPYPAARGGRVSGVHWAEYNTEFRKFGDWRGRPNEVLPVYVGRDQWQSINMYSGWTIEPHFGPQHTRTVIHPELEQVNIFIPFVPESYWENYDDAFTRLAAGEFDLEWQKFGKWLTGWQFPRRIHLIIAWEWNGNWFPFNGSHLPPDRWIACYRRIVEQIRTGYSAAVPAAGSGIVKSQLTFGTCNSTGNSPGIPTGYDAFDYFPGHDWCDSWGLNVYDHWEPVYTEADWDKKRYTQFNPIQPHADFAAAQGLEFAIPEWGIWNIDVQEGTQDPREGGNDNPFFIEKMFQWFTEANVRWETYFEHPATPYHWISPARVQHNPLSGAKYKELLPATSTSTVTESVDSQPDTLANAQAVPISFTYEDGTKNGWLAVGTSTLTNTSEQSYAGTRSLRITSTGEAATVTESRYLKVNTGTETVMSFYLRNQAGTGGRVLVNEYDSAGTFLRQSGALDLASIADTSWTNALLTTPVSADCAYIKVRVQVSNLPSGSHFYMDNVSMDAKTVATEPAPGDGGGTITVIDEFTGTDGTSWNTATWVLNKSSEGSHTIVGNRGRLSAGANYMKVSAYTKATFTGGTAYFEAIHMDAVENPYMALWAGVQGTNTTWVYQPDNGYWVEVMKSGYCTLNKMVNSTKTELAVFSVPNHPENTPISVEIHLAADGVKATAWTTASTKPASPNLVPATADTTYSSGKIGMGYQTAASASFADFDNIKHIA